MKKKILLSSTLTILLCLSLIVGSTMAMFTTSTTVNIAVTSGKLDVTATVDKSSLKTKSAGDDVFQDGISFENGGSASLNNTSNKLEILAMTPGDAVKFDITVANSSNIALQYRLTWGSNGVTSGKADMAEALDVSVYVGDKLLEMKDNKSAYVKVGPEESISTVFTVVIEFPNADNNNDFQNAEANLYFTIEAVQGNGVDKDGNLITTP